MTSCMERNYGDQLKLAASAVRAASLSPSAGSLGWSCPSNIALIKYWGKRALQLPLNPSLSMTLQEARTMTRLDYTFDPGITDPGIRFLFEGASAPAFENRVTGFIRALLPFIPVLAHSSLRIESENTFPHSSGIASSASAMGALALCLVQLEEKITGPTHPDSFRKKASFIARLGSGSASRSVYPRFALWGASVDWEASSDEYAIPVSGYHETFSRLRDTILVVESGEKKISSSLGHSLMDTNPYAATRFNQARQNLALLKNMLAAGDWSGFIEVMEEEALSLHAMMMTGRPGYLLMQPGTLSILQKVRAFRRDTGCRVGFTLDAGANVHLLYAGEEAAEVHPFINAELVPFCENGRIIEDRMGEGPAPL